LACKREGSIQQAESIQKKFTEALDGLVAQVKKDRSVLAAILCGSLSHDTVWAKSDIDLALVTIDDRKVEKSSLSLYAGEVNVHAFLMPRAEFRVFPLKGRAEEPFRFAGRRDTLAAWALVKAIETGRSRQHHQRFIRPCDSQAAVFRDDLSPFDPHA